MAVLRVLKASTRQRGQHAVSRAAMPGVRAHRRMAGCKLLVVAWKSFQHV